VARKGFAIGQIAMAKNKHEHRKWTKNGDKNI